METLVSAGSVTRKSSSVTSQFRLFWNKLFYLGGNSSESFVLGIIDFIKFESLLVRLWYLKGRNNC